MELGCGSFVEMELPYLFIFFFFVNGLRARVLL